MKKFIWLVLILVFVVLYSCPAASAKLSDEEIVKLAKYVKELEVENESLKKQNELLENGLNNVSDLSIKVDVQTQALIAQYESSIEVMNRISQRYEESLLRADSVIGKLEKRVNNLETQRSIWQVLGIAGIAYGASR